MAETYESTETSLVTDEPIPESESKYRPNPEAPAEPIPDWPIAREKWGFAWHFHHYGIAAAFLLVAAFVLFVLIRTQRAKSRNHKQRWIQIIVLSLLFIFNTTRSVSMFVDPYNSRKILPRPLLQFLWGLGHPCIITAYALIFVILKNALLLKQKFQNWYTAKNIALVTVPYFLFVFAGELIFGFSPQLKGIAFACQFLYVVFGFALSGFYTFIALLLWWKLGYLNKVTKQRGQRTRSIFRICVATATGGFVLCGLQCYGMAEVYGVTSNEKFADPWPWFAIHTALRLLELYLGVMLYFVSTQNSGGSVKKIEVAPITLTHSGQGKMEKEHKKEESITEIQLSIERS